jgi:hypothetical protein
MFLFLVIFIGVACGVGAGYFFNTYIALFLAILATFSPRVFIWDSKRRNHHPGTSGELGIIFLLICFVGSFIPALLITTLIINYDAVISFFKIIAEAWTTLLLR